MKKMQIFKTGTHTSANGLTLEFSEDTVKQAIDAYDPTLYEAPVVVGHPKDNHPAYGWIKRIEFDEGAVVAETHQLDPEFEEMVKAGRFKNRSASFYHPENPNNPKPGVYYLRHVGFLGAQPPAVKGLKAVEFAEDEGIIAFEFAEENQRWAFGSISQVFRGLKNWLIEKDGIDKADQLMPEYAIKDIENAGNAPIDEPVPSYTETNKPTEGDDTVTIEELQAQLADANAKIEVMQAEKDGLTEKLDTTQAEYSEFKTKMQAKEINATVDGLIKQGKITPAKRDMAAGLLKQLDQGASIEYGEGDSKTQTTSITALLDLLGDKPAVEFGEAGGDDSTGADKQVDIVGMAIEYQEKQAAAGRNVTTTQAVEFVTKQLNEGN